ncbi:hypothetical protein ALC57_17335 [Trachymyrmex cornetzi]|uniref:Uncharacterized protein n=1 Tax=Trachymyrmex cornetzi TaxID=471704 RepID=A0A195DCX4_9HYME|nr:hypothetical protein ALC57_17335 [Trachymyrmex cornetzi]
MRKSDENRRIVLAQGDVERALWCTWWSSWTVTLLRRHFFYRVEQLRTTNKNTNLINQRQRPAEIFLEDLEHGLLRDMRWEYAAIGAHDGVAFLRGPVAESVLAVPPVH